MNSPLADSQLSKIISEKKVKIIVNSSLTNEEVEAVLSSVPAESIALYTQPVIGNTYDRILKRGNKNAKWRGVQKLFEKYGADGTSTALDRIF